MTKNATPLAASLQDDTVHLPVMLGEVLATMQPKDGDVIVDGTFGAGGYTKAMLNAADCTVYGIDRDPDAHKRSEGIKQAYGDKFDILKGCFGAMEQLLTDHGVAQVDGVVLDIGVSSYQLDEADRGFSFRADGPLDMRMGDVGQTAADVVNGYDQDDLANILYEYGEEKKSRRIAAAIVKAREEAPITTTLELANIITATIGIRRIKGKKTIHPATRSFQALRIYVNDELGELRRGLAAAERILKPGGRLVVVSFHSLEDRIVKHFMAEKAGRVAGGSRHLPAHEERSAPTFKLVKASGLKPTAEEEARNPRARSARLRYALRTDAALESSGGDHA